MFCHVVGRLRLINGLNRLSSGLHWLSFGEYWENLQVGVWWGLPVHFYALKFANRGAQKLRRIILLHFGLITFNCHFPKIQTFLICMLFGPSANVHDPKNPFCLTLHHKITQNNGGNQTISNNIILGNLRISRITKMEQTRAGKILEARLINS